MKTAEILYRMAEMGFRTFPDGRFYVSVVHSEDDVAETARAVNRIFAESGFHEEDKP